MRAQPGGFGKGKAFNLVQLNRRGEDNDEPGGEMADDREKAAATPTRTELVWPGKTTQLGRCKGSNESCSVRSKLELNNWAFDRGHSYSFNE